MKYQKVFRLEYELFQKYKKILSNKFIRQIMFSIFECSQWSKSLQNLIFSFFFVGNISTVLLLIDSKFGKPFKHGLTL